MPIKYEWYHGSWSWLHIQCHILHTVQNDHSRYELSQWETTLHCNVVSHWLGPYPQWSLSTAMTKVDHVLRPTHIYLHGQAMGISTCMGKLWGVYSTSEKYNVSSKYDYWEQTPLINDLIYPIIYQHYVIQACYHSHMAVPDNHPYSEHKRS